MPKIKVTTASGVVDPNEPIVHFLSFNCQWFATETTTNPRIPFPANLRMTIIVSGTQTFPNIPIVQESQTSQWGHCEINGSFTVGASLSYTFSDSSSTDLGSSSRVPPTADFSDEQVY